MNDFELRRALRDLSAGRDPQRDLWPDIAERIHAAPAAPRRPRWPWPLALAASIAVASLAGLLWRNAPVPLDDTPPDGTLQVATRAAGEMLPREALALEIEYRAALASLPTTAAPAELRPALQALDDSAIALREALDQRPDAVYLLEQLQRTYAQRLRLSRPELLG